MLSRLSLAGGQSLRTCVFRLQQVSAITTSTAASDNAGKTNSPSSHPPEYPPPTSKRDFVNFPRPIWREASPPVRLGFIPDSWFQFMYPKTGYTGPYMLGITVLVYMFSKEKIVVDHQLVHVFALIILLTVIHQKGGNKIAEVFNKSLAESIDALDGAQEREKVQYREIIKTLEGLKDLNNAVAEVTKATTEVIQLQMELAFRERLHEMYLKVKNRLDCQAELENVERRITQRNLMDYVLRSVMGSLTPEFEKQAMQICVKDLNDLAAKS